MENQVVAAIQELDANQERRHKEALDIQVKPELIVLRKFTGFTAAYSQRKPELQHVPLHGSCVMVNNNRSTLTLRDGTEVTIRHPSGEVRGRLDRQLCGRQIKGDGDSVALRFETTDRLDWKQGDEFPASRVTLHFDQVEEPIILEL